MPSKRQKGKKSERRVKGRKRKVKVKTAVSLWTPPRPPKEKHHSGKKFLSGYHRETLHAPHKLTTMVSMNQKLLQMVSPDLWTWNQKIVIHEIWNHRATSTCNRYHSKVKDNDRKIVKCSECGLMQLKSKCHSKVTASILTITDKETMSLIIIDDIIKQLYT